MAITTSVYIPPANYYFLPSLLRKVQKFIEGIANCFYCHISLLVLCTCVYCLLPGQYRISLIMTFQNSFTIQMKPYKYVKIVFICLKENKSIPCTGSQHSLKFKPVILCCPKLFPYINCSSAQAYSIAIKYRLQNVPVSDL